MIIEAPISLGEGNTPLIRSRKIGPGIGLPHLYFKMESMNPTGSYKDRYAVAAVNDMLKNGKRRAIASSSGNAGSALAAYCAVAGIECYIAVVADAPQGKLKQMLAYGAKIHRIEDFGINPHITTDVIDFLKVLGNRADSQLQISAYRHAPVGMQGVETISYELHQQSADLGKSIDHVFACSGGGGLILAVARGFQRITDGKRSATAPRIHCVQPQGNNTIAGPIRDGAPRARTCERSTTTVSGLQVPNIIDGDEAVVACQRSGGTGFLVSDETVFQLQKRLALEEGIFCEPAAAVSLAGAIQAVEQGTIASNETVVCLVTGTGFKDPNSVDRMISDDECLMVSLDQYKSLMN